MRGRGGEGGRGERGGKEGEGGRGGGGRGGGGGGDEPTRILVLPSHRQPKSIGGGELHRRTLGLIYGFTQRHPPPPHDGGLGGVSGEGIKRWGIEAIRIGTSDRFGRGRGELGLRVYKGAGHYRV